MAAANCDILSKEDFVTHSVHLLPQRFSKLGCFCISLGFWWNSECIMFMMGGGGIAYSNSKDASPSGKCWEKVSWLSLITCESESLLVRIINKSKWDIHLKFSPGLQPFGRAFRKNLPYLSTRTTSDKWGGAIGQVISWQHNSISGWPDKLPVLHSEIGHLRKTLLFVHKWNQRKLWPWHWTTILPKRMTPSLMFRIRLSFGSGRRINFILIIWSLW